MNRVDPMRAVIVAFFVLKNSNFSLKYYRDDCGVLTKRNISAVLGWTPIAPCCCSYSDTTALLVVSARYICILVHELLFTAAVRVV